MMNEHIHAMLNSWLLRGAICKLAHACGVAFRQAQARIWDLGAVMGWTGRKSDWQMGMLSDIARSVIGEVFASVINVAYRSLCLW